ncbi:hypothetical protein [Microbacterium sp. SD291]|uniref:hypothetical protein n=1 Tax=Microbacterium sp. SD291 TaxID=2782007 RepID=UPI001A96287E|nr:hypothetical protein [Microbacterium sp. SD291]MBO0980533.1 hypothetical protein [Microbacterium sp. SD291]
MHWDRLFEDLEGQLASEWEAERAALDAESERLRISRLDLRSRLRVLCASATVATVDLPGMRRIRVRLQSLGADWVAAAQADDAGTGRPRAILIIPLHAVRGLALDHGMLLASLDAALEDTPSLRERMTLGFVLRDLARRRVAVRLTTVDGDDLHGTIDRAGSDHLDLAVHDQGDARVAAAVRSFRVVPFDALASVQASGDQLP